MQATERKYKHKASDKTCFKHISNQKSWMQMSWFWWLIKTKRILLFSDLSWSNWKEFSYLVDVSWWSPSTSQLIISFNLLGKAWTGSWLGLEYAWLVKGLVTEALNTPFLVNCELGELASSWASSPSKSSKNIFCCQQTFRTRMVVGEATDSATDSGGCRGSSFLDSATDSGGCLGNNHHLRLQTGFSCCSNRSHRRVPKPMERSSCWNPTKEALRSCEEFWGLRTQDTKSGYMEIQQPSTQPKQ